MASRSPAKDCKLRDPFLREELRRDLDYARAGAMCEDVDAFVSRRDNAEEIRV